MSIRIGFVGCGGIANMHMGNLAGLAGVELTAFTDIVSEKAEAAAQEYEGKVYEDHCSMYESADLDAVCICIPPYAHEDHEILAAQAGVAMFVEKPVALSMDKAREIEAAIADSGVINCVGYHWRYSVPVQRVKEQFAPDDVAMVMGYWLGGFPTVAWWRVMDQSGGQLVEQTTHIVDLARYFAGEVDTVYSNFALRCMGDVENIDVPDVGAVALKFASGAVGSICNSCCVAPAEQVGIHLALKGTWVEIDSQSLVIRDSAGGRTETFTSPDHAKISEVFVRAVQTNNQSLIRSDYADAVKTLAITLAANKSASTGQPVRVGEM